MKRMVITSNESNLPLKTYKGSTIKRSKYRVGKEIGRAFYCHKDYANQIVPEAVLSYAEDVLDTSFPDFEYNCIKYSPKTQTVSFQEAPDFDTAREPVVGDYVTVKPDGTVKTGHSNYIWHHKWLWVKDNYDGFDVDESKDWSRRWLNTLKEQADGNGKARWDAQLDKYNLPIESATAIEETLYTSDEPEYGSCYLIPSGLFVFNDLKDSKSSLSFHGDYMKYFSDDEEVYRELEYSILLNSRQPECSIRFLCKTVTSSQWSALLDWLWYIYDEGNKVVEVSTLHKSKPERFEVRGNMEDLLRQIKIYFGS